MNAIEHLLPGLVEKELQAANAKFPPFASLHEGYAVMKEEVDECGDAMTLLDSLSNCLWGMIKADAHSFENLASMAGTIEKDAIHLAAEAIQVAAMARKFLALQDAPSGERK